MTSGSFIGRSTSADGDDDFELVAILDQDFLMKAFRHDLAVSLHGDFLAGHLERLEHRPDIHGGVETIRCAVHNHFNHTDNSTAISSQNRPPPAALIHSPNT